MDSLGKEFERLRRQKVTDKQVKEYIEQLLPADKDATPIQSRKCDKKSHNKLLVVSYPIHLG